MRSGLFDRILGWCAFAACVLLVLQVLQGSPGTRVLAALALFLVAALGGFFLATLHLKKTLPPKAVVFLHAGLAVVAFLVLLSAVIAA